MSSPSDTASALRVQAVFHELQPHKAVKIAAEMVARAHELANMPECECDVDVSIESVAVPADSEAAGATGATPGAGAIAGADLGAVDAASAIAR